MENLQNVQIDEEFKTLLLPLSPEERELLEADIITNGCREPLTVWQGILLDGHNRWEICQKHNLPFKVNSIDLPDRNAALIWIVKNQLARRNMTKYDRVQLALRFKECFATYAKANQRQSKGRGAKGQAKSPDLTPMNTRTEVAKIAGVGEKMVSNVEFINKNSTPEIKEQLNLGQISVNSACKQIHDGLNPKVLGDTRLVDRRQRIRINRKEIRGLKDKLRKTLETTDEVKNQIKNLQDENRRLQTEIKELKGTRI